MMACLQPFEGPEAQLQPELPLAVRLEVLVLVLPLVGMPCFVHLLNCSVQLTAVKFFLAPKVQKELEERCEDDRVITHCLL